MRNTYNISRLRTRILGALPRPLSAVGEAALEAFLFLPGISAWEPSRLGIMELSFVFDIGLPMALIGENPSINAYAMHVGDAAREGRRPDPERWRVVHAAALLRHWGAEVDFAPEWPSASSSLAIRLPEGVVLEVCVAPPASVVVDAGLKVPMEGRHERARLLVVDARGVPGGHEAIIGTWHTKGPPSDNLAAVLSLEPRFWVGIEQKEWIHAAWLNPVAAVPVPGERIGGGDGRRRALRITLSS